MAAGYLSIRPRGYSQGGGLQMGGQPARPEQILRQMGGGQQAVVDFLISQGIPEEVARIYGPGLSMQQAQVAGMQQAGEEEARERTEAANAMAEQLVRQRMGTESGLLTSATGAVQQSLDRPLVDEYLQVQLMDRQRALIEAQRQAAIDRARERASGQGMPASGPALAEEEAINRAAADQVRQAQRDLGISGALYGQEQRNIAVGQAQGLAGQQLGRGDVLAGQLAQQYLGRMYQAPDYTALIAQGSPQASLGYWSGAGNQWTGQGQPGPTPPRGLSLADVARRTYGMSYAGQPNRTERRQQQGRPAAAPYAPPTWAPWPQGVTLTPKQQVAKPYTYKRPQAKTGYAAAGKAQQIPTAGPAAKVQLKGWYDPLPASYYQYPETWGGKSSAYMYEKAYGQK